VARRDCFEVAERIDASGNIILPLDETMVRSELIPALARAAMMLLPSVCFRHTSRRPMSSG
jgi:N-methylhydantoinase A/oxoprolinase/acetone carboxylase beta subunit